MMNDKKLSSSKVARITGNSELTIRNYKNGRIPRADFILKLCEGLDMNPNWFYGYEDKAGNILHDQQLQYTKTKRQLEVKIQYLEEQLQQANDMIINQRVEMEVQKDQNPQTS